MNILFLFENPIIPHLGGVERVTHVLAEGLELRGHKVFFLCTEDNKDRIYVDSSLSKKQFYIGMQEQDAVIKYIDLLSTYGIDVIINQEPRTDTLFFLNNTPSYIKVKKISCVHLQPFPTQDKGVAFLRYLRYSSLKGFCYALLSNIIPRYYCGQVKKIEIDRMSQALNASDYLCFLSERYVSRFLKYMPHVDVSKLVAINNPRTFNVSNAVNLKKEKLIVWVGRQANFSKNIPGFIDIWNLFVSRNPEWHAVIIGGGVDENYNRSYAKKKHVRNLEFLGIKSNVAPYYQKASFIGMTSFQEGWGMVLTEAMSYGCIPFAYDTYEALHDIIEDGVSGIIVSPYDKDRMVRRIEEIINNEDTFLSMQKASIMRTEKFSVDNIVTAWEVLLNK